MDSANRNFKWSSFCMFLFLLKTFQSYCLFLTIRSLINEQIWTSFSRNVFHIKEKYLYQKGVHTWSWNPAGFCHIALVGSHLQFPRSLLWQGSYRVVALRDWVASFLRTDNPSSPVEFILDPFIKLLYQPNFFFSCFPPLNALIFFLLLSLLFPSSSPGKSAHAAESRQHGKRSVWAPGDTSLER